MKKVLFFYFSLLFVLFSCGAIENNSNQDNKSSNSNLYPNDLNPIVSQNISDSQDFIFSTNSVGTTRITIRRSEWNKMLSYYDYFYKNENLVMAESYEYSKQGKKWLLNNVGFRLRGNTSRFRPQGKDTPTDEVGNLQRNAEWNPDYYEYAKNCSDDDYRQSHFKIDFEPSDTDNRKMSDCLKGMALKRSDAIFGREIYCYYLFHQYGIWTAPRACHTKVYIKFIEDLENDGTVKEDISECNTTLIDFGVYEMFEEVNKQSLKSRMQKNNTTNAENAWLGNDGDLWKCSGGDLSLESNVPENFGCEEILVLNTDKDKSQWDYIFFAPFYDLKTNKNKVDKATAYFQDFIIQLNALAKIDAKTPEGIQARVDFYEKWFDVDFFVKTVAVNMLVGMDDDYWGNKNNYYLYFDNGKNGSGKCYMIPFDYDNTMGCSITGDKVISNPMEWGNGENRPLMQHFLEVPEYKQLLKITLLEVSSQDPSSPWNKNNNFELWKKWHKMLKPFVFTKSIQGWPNIATIWIYDDGGWKEQRHFLTQEQNNIYEQVTNNFRYWLIDK